MPGNVFGALAVFKLAAYRPPPPFAALLACLALLAAPAAHAAAASLEHISLDRSGVMSGAGFYKPHAWGFVGARATNPTDSEFHGQLVVTVEPRTNVQFISELWLPPRAARQLRTPIMPLGESSPGDREAVAVQSWLIQPTARGERRTTPTDGLLMGRDHRFETAIVGSERPSDYASALARAHRESLGHERALAYLRPSSLPRFHQGLDTLDSVVLAGRDTELDPAQINALRDWTLHGGRLWLNLQQLDIDIARQILGDALDITLVDRVRFHDIALVRHGGDDQRFELDYGLEMLRVLADGFDVLHEVDGFPVTLRRSFGQGQVLITTIDLAAFLPIEDRVTVHTDFVEPATLPPHARDLGWFFQHPATLNQQAEAPTAAFDRYLPEQIGHTILPRTPVIAVLATFTLALLLAGLALARVNRLEWIGAVGVAAAVLAAGTLYALGERQRGDKTNTLAAAHLIQASEDQTYASADSLLGIYAAGSVSADIAGDGNAIAWPEHADRTTDTLRMLWHGEHRWTFRQLELPANAIRAFHLKHTSALDHVAHARARVTERGLEGRLHLPGDALGRDLADAVLASRDAHLGAQLDAGADGPSFTAGPDQRLAGDDFILGALLSQSQISRQAVYRRLFANPHFPERLTLLAWARDVDPAVELELDAERRSDGLVLLPVQLETPAPGQRVHVPAPLLAMDPYRDGPGDYGSAVFDARTRDWIRPLDRPERFLLGFNLPHALRDIALDGATVQLDLNGPGWRCHILVYDGHEVRTVATRENLTGRTRIHLDADDLPPLDEQGNIVLGLQIERLETTQATGPSWSLRHFGLEVTGHMPQE